MTSNESRRPLKKFSQNFLTNPFYQRKIIDSLHIVSTDIVLEIGPGKGALTQHIIDARPRRIIAVEIDERWVNLLNEKFGDSIEIIRQDILKIDLNSLINKAQRIKVVGNLPYHITSPILFHLIDSFHLIERAVLMMQKEVAQRLSAKPNSKDYGILSVITQAYAQVEYLLEIKRGNFFPVPNVDSAVVALNFYKEISDLADPILFRKIVRGTFNFRRKTLKNSLSRIFDKAFVNSLDEITLAKRPEQLTVEEFKQLTNQLK